ncbi:unnamed protein product, partial [marine sediment metagenome]
MPLGCRNFYHVSYLFGIHGHIKIIPAYKLYNEQNAASTAKDYLYSLLYNAHVRVHEYQAKTLFARYNIPVLSSRLIKKGEDVQAQCASIKQQACIVKAQIHAGARGKCGGIV